MLEEYLCLGGTEIANNARAFGYATSTDCPSTWFRCAPCDSLHDAVNDWVLPEWRTIEYGVNLFPDPNVKALTYFSSSAEWTLSLGDPGVVRTVRNATGAGRPIAFRVGTEMPKSSATITLRFRAEASEPFRLIISARPDVASATGEWQISTVDIPAGDSVVEVTGPSYAGATASANSGIALLGTEPLTGIGATLDVSEIMISPRPQLSFAETRRNYAIGTGAATGTTTGAITRTVGGTGVKGPFVLVRTNNALDPRATGLSASAWMSGSLSTLSTVTDGDGTTWARSTRNGTGSTGLIGIQIGTTQLASTSYRVRFRVRSSVATSIAVQLRSTLLSSTGSVQIATVAVPAGESVLDVSGASSATTPTATAGVLLVNSTTAVGATLDVTEVLHELVTTSQARGYFDGTTADDADNTYAWTGTVNLSSSTLTAREPSEVEPGSLRVTQTTQGNTGWSDSLVYYPGSLTTSGTAVTQVVPVVPGDVVRGYMEWRANRTRRMLWRWAWYDASNTIIGSLNTSGFTSPEPPAGAGEWNPTLIYTNTAPENAAFARLEIRSLSSSSTGSSSFQGMIAGDWVEFRHALITKNDTSPAFFDGDTLAPDGYTQYHWSGTANASPSFQSVATPLGPLPPFFTGDTPDPSALDDIFWMGTPNASTSLWMQQQLAIPGHSAEPAYTADNIARAPWYDADFEPSSRFYGVYIISMDNLSSSTRTASVTEGILDGGVVGLARHATREVRARVLLIADGDDALEYGVAWLTSALATTDCSSHGSACGAVDANFFAYCPAEPDPAAFDNDGEDLWDMELRAPRYLHNVTVTSGPLIEQKLRSSNNVHVGYIAEFTMVAATPFVYGVTSEVSLTASAPLLVQDIPFNLMPYPSAELAAGTVLVRTNYSTNPSVETDASGWTASVTGITPAPTGARSTEVAAQGAASFKLSVTTTNSTVANGQLRNVQVVTLPAEVAGQRFSVSMWGFAAVISGTAVLGNLRLVLEWLNASSTVLRTDNVATGPASGGALSGTGMTRPAGATSVRVYMIGDVTSWSTGAVLNLFADALALTSP